MKFESSPIEILQTCFNGTTNVLEFAVAKKARVLLASTSGWNFPFSFMNVPTNNAVIEVYGDAHVSTQGEDYRGNVNCFGPRACYDEGKRVMEALGYSYRLHHRLEVRIARIFNAYGPFMGQNDGRAVPNFVMAALRGEPMVIYGDGHSTRCFQFATDCVRGLRALMNSDFDDPVNIGNSDEVEIQDIAEAIAKVVASRLGQERLAPIRLLPKREDDPVQRKPEISRAKNVLGWRPKVKLEEGISITVDWFIKNNI